MLIALLPAVAAAVKPPFGALLAMLINGVSLFLCPVPMPVLGVVAIAAAIAWVVLFGREGVADTNWRACHLAPRPRRFCAARAHDRRLLSAAKTRAWCRRHSGRSHAHRRQEHGARIIVWQHHEHTDLDYDMWLDYRDCTYVGAMRARDTYTVDTWCNLRGAYFAYRAGYWIDYLDRFPRRSERHVGHYYGSCVRCNVCRRRPWVVGTS